MKKSKTKTPFMLVTQCSALGYNASCNRHHFSPGCLPITYMVAVACQDISWQTLSSLSTAVQPHRETAPCHLTASTFTPALQPTQRRFPPTALASLGHNKLEGSRGWGVTHLQYSLWDCCFALTCWTKPLFTLGQPLLLLISSPVGVRFRKGEKELRHQKMAKWEEWKKLKQESRLETLFLAMQGW